MRNDPTVQFQAASSPRVHGAKNGSRQCRDCDSGSSTLAPTRQISTGRFRSKCHSIIGPPLADGTLGMNGHRGRIGYIGDFALWRTLILGTNDVAHGREPFFMERRPFWVADTRLR